MTPGRYAVLASAIAARPLTVQISKTGLSFTDGTTIFVAESVDPADVIDTVAAQAGLLALGSLHRNILVRLARARRPATARYLTLELHRVAGHADLALPRRTVQRIKCTTLQHVPATPAESLRRACGYERLPAALSWAGTLQRSRFRPLDVADQRGAPTDADLSQLLEEQAPQQDHPSDDKDDESKIVNLLSAPAMSNPLGDALQKLLGMGRSSPTANQGSMESAANKQRFDPVGANRRKGRLHRIAGTILPQPRPTAGVRYPEWDYRRDSYRPDWCTVAEYEPALIDSPSHQMLRPSSALQRPLARVGNERQRQRRQTEGDSLDLAALVDYQADRRRGDDPVPQIYENSQLATRDLSVLILLDCSGSTSEESAGRIVFDEERQLAADLTAALERLGDQVATFGFYSRGRDAVRFLRIKDFDDRFDTGAKRRLTSVQPSGFTRMGAAIRHGTHVLESRAPAKNMVLLVIGDGLPYDHGYQDNYGRADTRQAIQEAIVGGVGVAGIGLRSSTEPTVLEDIWSDASFRVIGQATDVARHLHTLMLTAVNMTRGNGRRRDLLTREHHAHLRSLNAAARNATNSYV